VSGEYRCPGFRFAGARGGIKRKRALDLGLIVADAPAAAAAVFTGNRVKAAPVVLSQRALRATGGRARAIVVNSGNANACTGRRGADDARRMQATVAAEVGCAPAEVLVASTGVIGEPLPMAKVEAGIDRAAAALRGDGFAGFAAAILTTDRGPKTAQTRVRLDGGTVTLLGCTKGAGMIAPNMATTLTFVTTDAGLAPAELRAAVRAAVEPTYNAIVVDGDTSTNDMLAVLAGGRVRARSARDRAVLGGALTELLDDLAGQLMADGEGVHHVVTIQVRGAASPRAAAAVARRVATSPLVKTAIAGGDPNWGRIVCAAGNAGVALRPDRIAVWLDDVPICAGGAIAPDHDEARAAAVMRRRSYAIVVDLGMGDAAARVRACDLSHDYVSINADYRS
jgi:glutamate N-acetyltransferase / amino-acid N-acetyltransferase